MTIGIICAMELEAEKIISDLTSVKRDGEYYIAKKDEKEIYITVCGVGKVNAAAAAQRLIDKASPDFIINSGIAGGITADLSIGETVISEKAVYHDFNPLELLDKYAPYNKYFYADKRLIKLASEACGINKIKYRIGVVASGDCFVNDTNEKRRISEKYGADCVEMEGAAVAHVCLLTKVPFIVIRAISDFADESAEIQNDFEKAAAENAAAITIYIIEKYNEI